MIQISITLLVHAGEDTNNINMVGDREDAEFDNIILGEEPLFLDSSL